jgi:catechol 2,3-dioxygenase-like lactoylglutathione lyase family enzyme
MTTVEDNEAIDSGGTHQAGRAGRRLVATRRLRHPGAGSSIGLARSRTMAFSCSTHPTRTRNRSSEQMSWAGSITVGSVDSHFDQGDGLLGERTKVPWIRFHDRQYILSNQWREPPTDHPMRRTEPRSESYMELSIQTALLNVTDLQQSIDFYKDVFELGLISQSDDVAALMILEANRRQVLLLRELRSGSHHAGRRNVGLRMLSFETGSLIELETIERRLVERNALVWHKQTETYRGIMGVDPDRTEICAASSLTGSPISSEDWKELDDAIYAIE